MVVPRTTKRAVFTVRGLCDISPAGSGMNERKKTKEVTGNKIVMARRLKTLGTSEKRLACNTCNQYY